MSVHAVHWHEGMFLSPQHFQVAQRYVETQSERAARLTLHHNWGLRKLDLDLDALANSRFSVRSLEARLRDGTMVSVPADGTLPVLDLRDAFGSAKELTVYLALANLQQARANVSEENGSPTSRFVVDTLSMEDENTGSNPQTIQVRHLNLRLLHSNDDHAGYEVLPLARLRKADRAEALPQLDDTYFPPLLSCDAWKPLGAGVLERIYDRLGKKLDLLSAQVVSRNITFDSEGQGDQMLLEQLRAINESYAPLGMIAFTPGTHPATAFLELTRAVGKLAVFGARRRTPELPRYDHDDLGTCFWRLKQQVDALLDAVVEPEYKERPFTGAGLRMQVDLEPSWLEGRHKIYVGVQSPLSAEECDRLLTSGLDMKLGSSDRVGEIYRLGQAGLRFAYASHPPRALPAKPGLTYFEIQRDSQREEWEKVEHSLTLAIRLNENLIISDIQGQRRLTIQVGGQTATLEFTLYVVEVA